MTKPDSQVDTRTEVVEEMAEALYDINHDGVAAVLRALAAERDQKDAEIYVLEQRIRMLDVAHREQLARAVAAETARCANFDAVQQRAVAAEARVRDLEAAISQYLAWAEDNVYSQDDRSDALRLLRGESSALPAQKEPR